MKTTLFFTLLAVAAATVVAVPYEPVLADALFGCNPVRSKGSISPVVSKTINGQTYYLYCDRNNICNYYKKRSDCVW
jgi:hypothetical protein